MDSPSTINEEGCFSKHNESGHKIDGEEFKEDNEKMWPKECMFTKEGKNRANDRVKQTLDMVEKILCLENISECTNHMLEKSSDGYITSLGLYERGINKPKLIHNTNEMVKKTDMEDYDESCDAYLKHFYVTFSADGQQAIRIPFFEGETFFDALYNNTRFDQEQDGKPRICKCHLKNKEGQLISLRNEAIPGFFELVSSDKEPFHTKEFSLDFKHHILVTDMKDLIDNESRCVGAVIAVRYNHSKEPVEHHFEGTCFRIGKGYIMTNAHVLNNIEKHGFSWKDTVVSFNYTGFGGQTYHIDASANYLKVEALDYAILKLQGSEEILPPSVTDFGYQIALPGYTFEEPITLIGHPGGYAKSINSSCPLNSAAPYSNSDPNSLYIRQQHAAHYNVSTFFEGSSGSPGFLVRAKKIVVMHSQGHNKGTFFSYEEGVLMSSIVKDVEAKISGNVTLGDIFGEETATAFKHEMPMDIDN